jgi:hypothetical protein
MGNGKGCWKCFTGVSQREVTFGSRLAPPEGGDPDPKRAWSSAESVQVDRPVLMSALGQIRFVPIADMQLLR